MKQNLIFLAAAFGILTSPAASASPCVALEYQEMKDMSATELLDEACIVRQNIAVFLDKGISALGRTSQPVSNAQNQTSFEQCIGQAGRIERVLNSKGIAKNRLADLCALPPDKRHTAVTGTAPPPN